MPPPIQTFPFLITHIARPSFLNVILAGIAINLSMDGSILGPLFFLTFFSGGLFIAKWILLNFGYKYGSSVITQAFENGIIKYVTDAACVMGAIMVGALISTNVVVKLNWVPNIFGATVDIQSVLDSIMPGLLSVVLFGACMKAIQKGQTPIKIMLLIIAGCLVLAFLGIL